MTNTYEHLTGLFHSRGSNGPRTRMEVMVADEQIPYGSKLYQRGIDQFRENIGETLKLLDKRHVPVFISNLVSNEKDLYPFISMAADSVKLSAFKKSYAQAKAAFDVEDWTGAYRFFREAEGIDSMHALCNYYLGRLTLRQGDPGQAKAWFSRAEELDALRFRAPSLMNNIIPKLAAQYKNIHLVDARSAFEARSEYGIIGNELLLEHVHPNIYGYALMSDAFYRAMKAAGTFALDHAPDEKEGMTLGQLLASMPVLEMDSLVGAYKINKVKQSCPFSQPTEAAPTASSSSASPVPSSSTFSSSPSLSFSPSAFPPFASSSPRTGDSLNQRLAHAIVFDKLQWEDAMDTLYNYYSGRKDWAKAAKVVEALVLEHPTEIAFYDRAANIYGEMNSDADAVFWFRRSFSISPDFEKARKIFVLYLKLDKPADALPYLDYAMHNNNSGLNLAPVKQLAQEILRLELTSQKEGPKPALLNSIAAKYLSMGNKEGAARYIDSVLKIDPGNKEALSLKGR